MANRSASAPLRPRQQAHIYLREWLDHSNITAERLAARLDTNKGMISKLENGQVRYNTDWLEWIAYALGIEVADLFRPPPDPNAPPTLDAMVERLDPAHRQKIREATAVFIQTMGEQKRKVARS